MQSYLLKDYVAAMDLLERALAAGPSCAWAHSMSSLTLGYIGDYARCLTHAEHAVRLSPLGPDAFFHEHVLSQAFYLNQRYDEAVAWGRMASAHCGAQTSNLRTLIASLVAAGNSAEARVVAQRLSQLEPAFRVGNFRVRTPLTGEVAWAMRSTISSRWRKDERPDALGEILSQGSVATSTRRCRRSARCRR